MDDRTMLEWAAKAMGIDLEWNDHGNPGYWSEFKGLPQWTPWDPRHDDGDALRLAVKLDLLDEHAGFTHELAVQMGAMADPYAATRRAFVHVAAEIGRRMNEGSKT